MTKIEINTGEAAVEITIHADGITYEGTKPDDALIQSLEVIIEDLKAPPAVEFDAELERIMGICKVPKGTRLGRDDFIESVVASINTDDAIRDKATGYIVDTLLDNMPKQSLLGVDVTGYKYGLFTILDIQWGEPRNHQRVLWAIASPSVPRYQVSLLHLADDDSVDYVISFTDGLH